MSTAVDSQVFHTAPRFAVGINEALHGCAVRRKRVRKLGDARSRIRHVEVNPPLNGGLAGIVADQIILGPIGLQLRLRPLWHSRFDKRRRHPCGYRCDRGKRGAQIAREVEGQKAALRHPGCVDSVAVHVVAFGYLIDERSDKSEVVRASTTLRSTLDVFPLVSDAVGVSVYVPDTEVSTLPDRSTATTPSVSSVASAPESRKTDANATSLLALPMSVIAGPVVSAWTSPPSLPLSPSVAALPVSSSPLQPTRFVEATRHESPRRNAAIRSILITCSGLKNASLL